MKKKYLLAIPFLIIGYSPPAKSAITLDFLKQKMIDYCIPKEGTNCDPSRQAIYSSEDGGTCICGAGTQWIDVIQACAEPCPAGNYILASQSSDVCPGGSYAVAVATDGEACPGGTYQEEINY